MTNGYGDDQTRSGPFHNDQPPGYSDLGERVQEDDDEVFARPQGVETRKRLWWRNAIINLFFIACWFVFATLLSVYNKWMFSPDRYGFTWPLFVTTCHMTVQFALAAFVRYMWAERFRPANSPNPREYLVKVVPTALATGLDIGLSNVSLKLITLSFYTMCKSSSLIFVLSFAFLFRLEVFSLRLIGVITLIFMGFLMMVATETHFVLSGFILVTSGAALGGLRWSLTQLLLRDKGIGLDNPAATIYWMAPSMAVILALISMVVEGWPTVLSSHFFTSERVFSTILLLTAPGTVAFAMVLSEFYIIQRAGVVPMSIAGIAKEVTTICISALVFGDELTFLNMIGVAITVCGIGLFTYHKYEKSVHSNEPMEADDEGVPMDYVPLPHDLNGPKEFETSSLESLTEAQHDDMPADRDRSKVLFSVEEDEIR